jgi:hypothetical protein
MIRDMNIVPASKTILCYGDSITHGQISATYSRYATTERWVGILQSILGSEYCVIEEGLGGRTVDIDEPGALAAEKGCRFYGSEQYHYAWRRWYPYGQGSAPSFCGGACS